MILNRVSEKGQRSTAPLVKNEHHPHHPHHPHHVPPKLNIAYLLNNDPMSDEKSERKLREVQSSRDLRSHRPKTITGSSRRLHVPTSVRELMEGMDRYDRKPMPPSTQAPVLPTMKCSWCGEAFQHISLLDDHKRRFHGDSQSQRSHRFGGHSVSSQSNPGLRSRIFTCDECGSVFSEKGNLNRHVRSVHKKEKPWECERCHTNFAFRDALNRHVAAVHLDLRPFECPQCIAKFKKRAHLQRHLSTCHRRSP